MSAGRRGLLDFLESHTAHTKDDDDILTVCATIDEHEFSDDDTGTTRVEMDFSDVEEVDENADKYIYVNPRPPEKRLPPPFESEFDSVPVLSSDSDESGSSSDSDTEAEISVKEKVKERDESASYQSDDDGNVEEMSDVSAAITDLKSTPPESAPVQVVVQQPISNHFKVINGNLIIAELEKVYTAHRKDIVEEDGLLRTPSRILRRMSEDFNVKLHFETFKYFPGGETNWCQWRVEVYCASIRGYGEAGLRMLALEMACVDALIKVKEGSPEARIPLYALLPGCRIRPRIFKLLDEFCMTNNLEPPEYDTQYFKPDADEQRFKIKCIIGQLEVTGKSDSLVLAKRIAARKMLELLGNHYIQDEPVLMGTECRMPDDLHELGIEMITSVEKQQHLNVQDRVAGMKLADSFEEEGDDDVQINFANISKQELSSLKRTFQN